MKIFVGQIYIQPGITYPFSNQFQKTAGEFISVRVEPTPSYRQKYSDEYELIFRMSARSNLSAVEIKGPTVFKKDKDIEFTIFLPHSGIPVKDNKELIQPLQYFFDGVVSALESIGIDANRVATDSSELIRKIIYDDAMLKN